MGICVPKPHNGGEEADLGADGAPLSPASKRRSELPRFSQGAQLDEEPRSPDPSPTKGGGLAEGERGEIAAPKPPARRKASLQMDAEDMSKMLTQLSPGTPMSPTGRRSPMVSPGGSGAALLPPPSLENSGKRCLVIDLDETLVHTERQPSGFTGGRYDFKISVKFGASTFQMYVAKRPGCDHFLRKAAENFELVIFTASVEPYCTAVMERIDPDGIVSACLHRTHCTFYQNELYVKDLSRLGRDLPNCILLDNNADCYLFQPQNAIPINSWYDDKTDTDLDNVLGILDVIATSRQKAVKTLAEIDDKLGWNRMARD